MEHGNMKKKTCWEQLSFHAEPKARLKNVLNEIGFCFPFGFYNVTLEIWKVAEQADFFLKVNSR